MSVRRDLIYGKKSNKEYVGAFQRYEEEHTTRALDFCSSDRGSIPRQVEMFINLKCSFRMRPWESLHQCGPTAPVGPHPLCVKCCLRC